MTAMTAMSHLSATARTHPNPPAIDDSLPLGNAATEAAMEVDEQGVLAALIHTTYLLRALATGLLPEMCVWYTEHFGKEEIPFDDWVNHYRIEQDEKAASVHQDILSKFASDGLGKPDEEEGNEGSAKVVQDKRSETLEKSDKEVDDNSTDAPPQPKLCSHLKLHIKARPIHSSMETKNVLSTIPALQLYLPLKGMSVLRDLLWLNSML
ncbi:hypothetical protein BDP27DRAFT_1370904 [Rhodocollybia butyracea]|uniref:Uncharacterized protein n=1 Tax=Rhodocollybia butyracea TaxID=206335 RepID=A0A9P5PB04_9AGAR|nr:hypothetical protein BDP27DRAFT_1370904 [Rhodocollybia butyracea]